HPYRNYAYYDPFYVRRSISINVVNVDRNVYVWQPRHHRIGERPGRVTVTREGVVRADYGTRRYVSRDGESRRTVTTRSNNGGSVATSSERTVGASAERRTAARSSASGQRAVTPSANARSSSARDQASGATRDNPSANRRAAASSR